MFAEPEFEVSFAGGETLQPIVRLAKRLGIETIRRQHPGPKAEQMLDRSKTTAEATDAHHRDAPVRKRRCRHGRSVRIVSPGRVCNRWKPPTIPTDR